MSNKRPRTKLDTQFESIMQLADKIKTKAIDSALQADVDELHRQLTETSQLIPVVATLVCEANSYIKEDEEEDARKRKKMQTLREANQRMRQRLSAALSRQRPPSPN